MRQVNIHEAKTHLSRLVDEAAQGEGIVIARAGKPVARLVAAESHTNVPRPGLLKGVLEIADDFDAPLPDDILAGFDGRE
jgi:prevent-host-death family protein